ncbi:nucleotidyl transferase AbiEii/AbiGii toxin family protein [Flavilitoribacter nigricans]|uniref:Nucleotidyltransferase n=1 Tax=Flavilitoribacter nigricans (strain ATCC 23147 / DSM 23189 / NBRC 102662 / NCIMB 1420 / SS-2) TaxID=1122177 RepID=A0A2D0NJK6_FLAN2|nr:nucleotidyl transferase AbiEii/AbiGii toxin family protein [Flavilitoribacter nigricans]PHN08684.1 nucleotidyltransferase [Flavilitoribacter nigricans DSM 23189 = NBRC 102662]
MIPQAFITEWSKNAPWPEEIQVEQDLLIERTLVEIYQNPFLQERLAFRGGTALHKLYLRPQVRYSEDIDLVQIQPEPIKATLKALRQTLSFLGQPSVRQKKNNNTMIFRVPSEFDANIRLKIEINCREHFVFREHLAFPYRVESSWFTGETSLTTYTLEELLATKMRALYQRKKGRDLFDLWYALAHGNVSSEQVVEAWKAYHDFEGHPVSQKQFLGNLEIKIKDDEFSNDITGLLRPAVAYDAHNALDLVKDQLINKI